MSDLSLGAATTKFRAGRTGEPVRGPGKRARMSVQTAIGVMQNLRPVILDLIEREVTMTDPSNGLERPVRYINATGNLLAATVLQGLSVETGLKLLYELEQPSRLASDIHNLDDLFDELSLNVQKRLAEKYKERVGRYASSSLSESVRDVLAEHAKMFVLWRYMYESGPSGPGYSGELVLAVDAMVDLATELYAQAAPLPENAGTEGS